MKIVEGSLLLQDQEIFQAVQRLYGEIFPLYFSEFEVKTFKKYGILEIPDSHSEIGTLKGAFQAMSSLHTITILLEKEREGTQEEGLFNRNARMLNEIGLYFPLNYQHFFGSERINTLSMLRPSNATDKGII